MKFGALETATNVVTEPGVVLMGGGVSVFVIIAVSCVNDSVIVDGH